MLADGYTRYSTDRQTENSTAYQRAKIQEYCTQNGIALRTIHSDEAKSGTNADRAGFQAVIEAARRREIDAVVIYDVSRGSRDVGDWFTFRKQMMQLGVQVISATQPLGNMLDPNDFLVELINVGLGQHQVLSTRQKSIDGVKTKAEQGAFLGGYPPFGYEILDGQYTINEHEAVAVRRIFAMYAEGKGYGEIIDWLAEHGYRGKRGKPIGKNSLYTILRNERYIGTYSWNKRRMKLMRKWAGGGPNPNCVTIEHAIPAIIEQKTWERAQERMMSSQKPNTTAKYNYLLSGLIECAACGAAYVGHASTNKKGYTTRYYICGNKYRTRTCTAHNVNADEIETFVVQQLKQYFLGTNIEAEAQKIADQINNATPDLSKEKAELASITAQINNGVKALLTGMDFPELADAVSKLRMRKSELEDIILRADASQPKVNPQDIVDLFHDSIEHFAEDHEHMKEIIKQHITKIYAHLDGSFEVQIGVHIAGCGGRI
ncbi:MAG TPA: recombinase family protein [Candidatus Fimivicinus intestinavium]|nr:recombinase family protein [Candidatus Fimivicinus intestinavium]